jgi:hypothetical protein
VERRKASGPRWGRGRARKARPVRAPFGALPPFVGRCLEGLSCSVDKSSDAKVHRENDLPRHCEERSDEAIQGQLALSAGLLRSARNDEGEHRPWPLRAVTRHGLYSRAKHDVRNA